MYCDYQLGLFVGMRQPVYLFFLVLDFPELREMFLCTRLNKTKDSPFNFAAKHTSTEFNLKLNNWTATCTQSVATEQDSILFLLSLHGGFLE